MAFTTTTTTTTIEEAHNASPAAEPIISSEGTNGSRKIIHHVMILEHGICGNASELGYVSEACLREYKNSESKTRNKENTSSLLVHSAVCNEGRLSLDGIENGGLRLADEINNVIHGVAIDKHKQNNDERVTTTIALSIVGNSMGGLYGRYALKYIKFYFTLQAEVVGSTNTTVAVDVLVVPNVFVTTATPHLGIKNMTYWKVPEFLEPVGAWMFGKSSNDLFRRRNNKINNANNANNANANNTNNYSDIIEQLAFDPAFIGPLSKFKRRIAYANAFSTDIAVTTTTAAFLVVEENNNDDNNDDNKDPCCASILESSINDNDIDNDNTPQDFDDDDSRSTLIIEEVEEESELLTESSSHMFVSKQYSSICFDTANTAQYNRSATSSLRKSGRSQPLSVSDMARNLDSLGWSKVFVDNRPHIPALWKRKRKSFDSFESSTTTTTTTTTTKSSDGGRTRINSSSANNTDCYYSSCELKRRFSTNGWDGNTLPFGHSFLVASSRDPVHRFLYKSARPFVDQVIAKKVMNEMLQF